MTGQSRHSEWVRMGSWQVSETDYSCLDFNSQPRIFSMGGVHFNNNS